MNDCLSLPLRQGGGGTRTLGGWEAVWVPLGEGESDGLPGGAGVDWQPVQVPEQHAAREGRQAIWYRTRFGRPEHGGRVLLRFGGAFLAANVWLNGRLLGSHYGYFAPFGFDVTSHLRPDNLLVVCCESPVELDLARKRHVLGMFGDGDNRPYPASAHFSLPEPYRWEVPVGLWQPVELEYLGPVAVDWLRLRPRLEGGDGRLEVEARLRNLDGREMAGEVGLEVEGAASPVRLRRAFRLAGGTETTVGMALSVPQARRWSAWRFGEPHLHTARLTVIVGERVSAQVSDEFGFRSLDVATGVDAWSVRINGQPAFLRGATYSPSYRLDQLSVAQFDRDLELARSANLDALRVHAHVLPPEFYRRADAAGMLVIADFPLTGPYAYHAAGEEAAFFESAVREQVPEMVEMLRNRPSIALWVAHDDPAWVPARSELGDVHAVRLNYSIDQEARALFERLDPTRSAVAASGETDGHLYLGWTRGGWPDFANLPPAFVSEMGAQAHPSADSTTWREMGGARWPVTDDDPAWLHAGYDAAAWVERGAGGAARFESLEEMVEAGQAYQAWVLRYGIEQLRKRKFEPCHGVLYHQFVDPLPAIGFGVLDHFRLPRAAFEAARHAMAAVRVIIDPVGFLPVDPFGVAFLAGRPHTLRLVVVNDDPRLTGRGTVRWSSWEVRPDAGGRLSRFRGAVSRRGTGGLEEFPMPTFAEPALQVASLNLPGGGPGRRVFEAELLIGGRVQDRARLEYELSEAAPPPRPPTWVPRHLAERLLRGGSLRVEDGGVSFSLLNRTRPAVLTGIRNLRLDGVPLADARVHIDTPSGRLPLPRRLDLPVGRDVRIHALLDTAADGGRHHLDFHLSVPGLAEGRVMVTTGAADPA